MKFRYGPSYHALALACLAGWGTTPAHADTDHIREMAKSKARTFIVTSGPESAEVGRMIQAVLMRHKDNKHTIADLPLLSLEEADKAASSDPKFGHASLVFVLLRKEMSGPMPAALRSAFLLSADELALSGGALRTVMSRPPNKNTAFTVAMCAPDAERLNRLHEIFLRRSAPKVDGLAMSETFEANKVAVFSGPEDRTFLEGWGGYGRREVWDYIEWYPLAERAKLTPEQLEEFSEVYFINRTRGGDGLPEPVSRLLETHGGKLKETSTLVTLSREGGKPLAVVSCPTHLILQKKAARYANLETLSKAPLMEDVVDLRRIGRTALRVNGGDRLSDGDRDQIRLSIARDMRQTLRLDVEERGETLKDLQREITVQDLLGSPDTAKMMRAKKGTRYIWMFQVTEYSGSTQYRTEERSLSPDPGGFRTLMPSKPSSRKGLFGTGGRKDPAQYQRELNEWERAVRKWEGEKREYEEEYENHPCQWERSVTEEVSARVRGILQLVDLQDPDGGGVKVLWEKECSYSTNDSKPFQSDRVTVRGYKNHPGSMEAPPSSSKCPAELLHAAAYRAGKEGLDFLQEEAWLPDGSVPVSQETVRPPDRNESRRPGATASRQREPIPIPDRLPLVAAVNEDVLTLNIGSLRGVKVGDRIDIPLEVHEIKDPQTGELLRTDTKRGIILKVSRVDPRTSDCTPVNAAEAAEMKDVKVGMPAKWRRSPAPAAPAVKRSRSPREAPRGRRR